MYFSYVLFENLRKCHLEFILGPAYSSRQRHCCDNSAMMLAILFSLKTKKLLQIEVATHFQATPFLFNENSVASVIAEWSRGANAWFKRARRLV